MIGFSLVNLTYTNIEVYSDIKSINPLKYSMKKICFISYCNRINISLQSQDGNFMKVSIIYFFSSSAPERIGKQILYFTAKMRVMNTEIPPTI